MSDDWKTPSELRRVGHLRDASGHDVAISAVRNVVVIRHGGLAIHLRATEREDFQQVFMQAEREAGAWAAQNPPGDADVVEAEVWCGNPGECVNGPDSHLWAGGSCRERQTPVSDPCTFAATFRDRDSIPCAWPRGHTGLHSWMPVP